MAVLIQEYRPGTWRRVCDICGSWKTAPVQFDVKGVDGVWICSDHKGMRTIPELDRINARRTPRSDRPVPSPKPRDGRDTWEAEEGYLFNFICDTAPYGSVDQTVSGARTGTTSVQDAALACWYLYDLIAENQRPPHWITRAKAKLLELADWLYDNQVGGPGKTTYTDDALQWGAFSIGSSYFTSTSSLAGIALLRAYQVHGKAKHLAAARATAWFLRSAQCGDLLSSGFSSADAAGLVPKHWGAWTFSITTGGTWDHKYFPGDLIGVWFLTLFKNIAGDETIGSSTITVPFNASRATLVSTAIGEAKAFWSTAQYSADDGANIQGFSATTPRSFFQSYPTGRGSWEYLNGPLATGTTIGARNWSTALRALYEVDGLSSQVTSIWDWLMTFSSNSDYELDYEATSPLDTEQTQLWRGLKGDYDPTLAPSTVLLVREGAPLAATKKNGSTLYDWAAAGLLAPIQSARNNAAFRTAKEAVSSIQPTTKDPLPQRFLRLNTLGQSGLSLQPYTNTNLTRVETVTNAALVGSFYRQEPKAFMGRLE